jgi:hypothetical protein
MKQAPTELIYVRAQQSGPRVTKMSELLLIPSSARVYSYSTRVARSRVRRRRAEPW